MLHKPSIPTLVPANGDSPDELADGRRVSHCQLTPARNKQANKVKSAALILHDIGSKEERKDWVEDFKAGKIDLLFVYNMLLTGFDAKRLKKLYLGRVIRKHNLLQALTRVNRPYKDFRYGYVVDFADIRKEFDATNKAYFEELQAELGDEMEHYSHLFKSAEEIAAGNRTRSRISCSVSIPKTPKSSRSRSARSRTAPPCWRSKRPWPTPAASTT